MRPVLAGSLLLALAACEEPLTAPTQTGVCWRLDEAMNGKSDFRPMRTDVPRLQDCAIQLEGLRLRHGTSMVGAYQGQIIYATDTEISAAASPKAKRYPLFTPEQRVEVDRGLKQMMDSQAP